ncbi:MAG TPA: D-alanyl-D-alanine carboxypeptidase family protein [Opitutaceae bacterium]
MNRRAICACLAALGAAWAPALSGASYKGAISTDAATGAVLYESNADAVSPPASMTKLMTFAVVDDEIKKGTLSLDTQVTVTRETARVAAFKDSTEVWLRQGEVFSVRELIYAMMIQSANDAAYALAQRVGGTAADFVTMMNAKAKALGMVHTTFRSPHGFPPPSRRIADGDLTTPRDYALLCRYLIQRTEVLTYTSVKNRAFGAGIRLKATEMSNHNNLLGKCPGVDGLKTGFTNGAGFCISATAQRDGRRVIVVVMDSPDQRTRDLNTKDLIEQAFIRLPLGAVSFPANAEVPAAPTRPSPTPSPTEGPVIHMPRPGGN